MIALEQYAAILDQLEARGFVTADMSFEQVEELLADVEAREGELCVFPESETHGQ